MRVAAGIAQLVEHLICNQGVTSSNLVAGTNKFKGLEGIFLLSPFLFFFKVRSKVRARFKVI